MNTTSQDQTDNMADEKAICVKIFGVGNTGVLVAELLAKRELSGVSFVAVNSDKKSLSASSAAEKIELPKRAKDDDGRRSRMEAEAQFGEFKKLCAGADVIFIVAGLGGAAGTAVAPVLARAAREAGALALAFVTQPFDWEGNRRQQHAERGLEQLKSAADGVICLANQKIAKCVDEKTSVLESFKFTNELLAEGILGMWRLVAHKGLIEIHFSDLCELVREQLGESCFACAESTGPVRSKEVLEKLLAHPLLDGGQVLTESSAVLVSLLGGPDLTMAEVNRVMEQLNRQCERAQIIMGAAIDERFQDRLSVTIVVARRDAGQASSQSSGGQDAHSTKQSAVTSQPTEGLDSQLLNNRAATTRPASRIVAPPPSMGDDQMRQLAGRNGGRGRKSASRTNQQGQLPLEIISKGRFDKSEPTIHKGEDLDVPTYIRRGIALN